MLTPGGSSSPATGHGDAAAAWQRHHAAGSLWLIRGAGALLWECCRAPAEVQDGGGEVMPVSAHPTLAAHTPVPGDARALAALSGVGGGCNSGEQDSFAKP